MLHSRLLRYLDEAARLGSIRKAASRLNVASSAINRQILALEEELGVPIFERMPRPGHAQSCWGYLGNAYFLAAYRNQGTGQQLLNAVLRYADENDFARVVLSPSARSIPFYERAGFGPADTLMLRTPPER